MQLSVSKSFLLLIWFEMYKTRNKLHPTAPFLLFLYSYFPDTGCVRDTATLDQLAIIKKILIESTDIICDNLNLKPVLRTMKAKGALTPDDAKLIESKPVESDQVEVMLNTLMKKPASAYDIFVETLLANGRSDLCERIREIEMSHGYVRVGMVNKLSF